MRTNRRTRLAFASLPILLCCLLASPVPAAAQEAEPPTADGGEAVVPAPDDVSDERPHPDETTTRTYYVAAERVTWDYAPGDVDRLYGVPFDTALRVPGEPTSDLHRYYNAVEGDYAPELEAVSEGIGDEYRKVLYRAYTDSTFTERVERPPEWEHLGFLGPLLRAEVGDTIKVVFKNQADRPYSMHPHGVFYEKHSEGKAYRDGTPKGPETDDAVPPGETHTYVWPVPERAGPGPEDPSSVLWMYHSHVHEDEDIATGLVGPMIVTRRGMAGPDGAPEDVDREFVTLFESVAEHDSWLTPENIRRYTDLPVDSAIAQPQFNFSNTMSSINGFIHANMPVMTMREGERVRWYVFSGTNFVDIHTVHWHGQTVLVDGHRSDMIDVEPMMMVVADMRPDNPGTWLLHCHVDFHFKEGMSALFEVLPAEEGRATANRSSAGTR